MHSKNAEIIRCNNPEIVAHRLESAVLGIIEKYITDPSNLKPFLDSTGNDKSKSRVENNLANIEQKISVIKMLKKESLENYAKGKVSRNEYAQLCQKYDNQLEELKQKRKDFIKKVPSLHKSEVVDVSLRRYCETVKARFEKCSDFDSKRQFLLDFVEQITYDKNNATVHGSVPIKLKAYSDSDQSSEANKIEFIIEGRIKPGN